MKRWALAIALLSILVWMAIPQALLAGTTAYITITATGSEVDISCNQTAWVVNSPNPVGAADNIATSDAWARITNNTSEHVDITIHGHDMKSTDNVDTWDLTDNGTYADDAFGMQAALSGGDFNVTIREAAAFNTLVSDMGETPTTQDFGMCFVAPSPTLGNKTMEMVGETNSNVEVPRGVCLTASIHV